MYIVQGVPNVYEHTFGFIPPPWFIFEGCCFADGSSQTQGYMIYTLRTLYLFEVSVTKI